MIVEASERLDYDCACDLAMLMYSMANASVDVYTFIRLESLAETVLERLLPQEEETANKATAWWLDSEGVAWELPCFAALIRGVRVLWTHDPEAEIDDIVVDTDQPLREYAEEVANNIGEYLGDSPDHITCPECGQEVRWAGQITAKQYHANRIEGWCGCPHREWVQENRGGEWVLLGYEGA